MAEWHSETLDVNASYKFEIHRRARQEGQILVMKSCLKSFRFWSLKTSFFSDYVGGLLWHLFPENLRTFKRDPIGYCRGVPLPVRGGDGHSREQGEGHRAEPGPGRPRRLPV